MNNGLMFGLVILIGLSVLEGCTSSNQPPALPEDQNNPQPDTVGSIPQPPALPEDQESPQQNTAGNTPQPPALPEE